MSDVAYEKGMYINMMREKTKRLNVPGGCQEVAQAFFAQMYIVRSVNQGFKLHGASSILLTRCEN